MPHALKSLPSLEKIRTEYKALLKLGLPVLVTQLGIILVNFADTMMVGAYGVDELASSAFVNSLFVIVIVMQIGFASGITPLVGALFSREKHYDTGRTLRAGMQMNIFVSIIFTLIMAGIYPFLDCFGQPEELLPLIREYYLIILFTLVPMSLFNCLQQTANGMTDTMSPMWVIVGADIINIIGNWLLIFGHLGFPEMGLAGAGYSTLTARICAMLAMGFIILHTRRYRPLRAGLGHRESLSALRRKVWVTSYPVMIQSGVECMLWSLGAVVCGWFGKIQLAAFQVVNTISQLGFMTYMSFGIATSIRVANMTGIKDMKAARRTTTAGLHLNLVLSTLASLIFLIGGKWLIGVFTPNQDVVACGVALVGPLILYQYGDAVQLTYANALRGTSIVKPLLWISAISYLMVGAPVLLLLGPGIGLESVGVYLSFSAALFTASFLLVAAFRKAVRQKEREFGINLLKSS